MACFVQNDNKSSVYFQILTMEQSDNDAVVVAGFIADEANTNEPRFVTLTMFDQESIGSFVDRTNGNYGYVFSTSRRNTQYGFITP